jgi:hypothetical protein
MAARGIWCDSEDSPGMVQIDEDVVEKVDLTRKTDLSSLGHRVLTCC